jgi:hypothetical protein
MDSKFKVKIGEREYPLPQYITCRDFASINGYNLEGSEHDSLICATLLGVPLSVFRGTDARDLSWLKLALIKPLAYDGDPQTTIEGYTLISFDHMSIGTFADLDVLYTEGFQANVESITCILWNAPHSTVSQWDITRVLPSLLAFKNWRLELYSKYKNLFGGERSGESDNDESSISPRHAWYTLLMTLCADRFIDLNEVQSRPAIEALNYLAYMKSKNAKLAQQMKKGLKKLKR